MTNIYTTTWRKDIYLAQHLNKMSLEEKSDGRYSSLTFYPVFTLTYIASNKNNNYNKYTKHGQNCEARQLQLKEEAVELA